MKAHIVLAHPEPQSFNGHLARVARAALSAQGYSVTLSDLYAMGFSGDIDLLLWPVNLTFAYVGFDVLSPFVAYGVEAGLRYSDASVVETRLKNNEQAWCKTLASLGQRTLIPFNRMVEWGNEGRIVPDAPVYSPFIRRRKELDLE